MSLGNRNKIKRNDRSPIKAKAISSSEKQDEEAKTNVTLRRLSARLNAKDAKLVDASKSLDARKPTTTSSKKSPCKRKALEEDTTFEAYGQDCGYVDGIVVSNTSW